MRSSRIDRDFGFLGFGQHVVPAGGDDRRDEDRVDALGDEGAERLDLVFLLLLGVGEFQVDAALLGLLLGDRGFGGAPAGFRADLRKADGQRPRREASRTCRQQEPWHSRVRSSMS